MLSETLYEVLGIDPAWTFAADDPNTLGAAGLWPHQPER